MSDKSKEKEPKKEEENNQKEDKLKKTGSDEDDIDILKNMDVDHIQKKLEILKMKSKH